VVPLKILEKKWGHFLKMDILKMSNFQNLGVNVGKKNENLIFTRRCFKYQKNRSKVVIIIFYIFFRKQLRIIFYGYNMENLGDKNQPKNQPKFYCKNCDYGTSKKTNYNTHIISIKHKRVTDNYIKGQKPAEIQPTISKHLSEPENFICSCGKEYKHRQGLWRHRKTCYTEHTVPSDATSLLPFAKGNGSSSDIPIELVLEVIKQSKEVQNVLIEQNKELQKQLLEHSNKLLENENRLLEKDNQLIEQNKQILEIAKKPNMINSNNKTSFNLQIFLNETCKDAMNIVDFVNSLQLTNNDFETTGKLGFVNGISRIFINQLKKMDVIRRPLHCTDVKRETVYIKDNDAWEKETDEKKKLNWVVNRIAQLNLNQIQQWQQEYPDSVKNNTPDNEKFTELALVALGGRDMDEIHKYNDKIMKNVLKEVILSRSGEP